jgi:hypothetical protein
MFSPRATLDNRGHTLDYMPRPHLGRSVMVSLDARNRRPMTLSSPADFTISLPTDLKQIASIELVDGFISLPGGYTDPYVLLFLSIDDQVLSNVLVGIPPRNYTTSGDPQHDAGATAFAHLAVTHQPEAGIFVNRDRTRRLILRFPSKALDKGRSFRVLVTDFDGTPLNLSDANQGTDRCWLQFEICASNF